jgi:hypothetical protein
MTLRSSKRSRLEGGEGHCELATGIEDCFGEAVEVKKGMSVLGVKV